mmetsp:Transcript_86025/g.271225  ORF Transcript_86025/g.271225 Transcript_86025/m.271225 type:complete len:411 (+) Transcript_86025:293-1525(+)
MVFGPGPRATRVVPARHADGVRGEAARTGQGAELAQAELRRADALHRLRLGLVGHGACGCVVHAEAQHPDLHASEACQEHLRVEDGPDGAALGGGVRVQVVVEREELRAGDAVEVAEGGHCLVEAACPLVAPEGHEAGVEVVPAVVLPARLLAHAEVGPPCQASPDRGQPAREELHVGVRQHRRPAPVCTDCALEPLRAHGALPLVARGAPGVLVPAADVARVPDAPQDEAHRAPRQAQGAQHPGQGHEVARRPLRVDRQLRLRAANVAGAHLPALGAHAPGDARHERPAFLPARLRTAVQERLHAAGLEVGALALLPAAVPARWAPPHHVAAVLKGLVVQPARAPVAAAAVWEQPVESGQRHRLSRVGPVLGVGHLAVPAELRLRSRANGAGLRALGLILAGDAAAAGA